MKQKLSNKELFQTEKYCFVKNAVSKDIVNLATQYTLFDEKKNFKPEGHNMQVPTAHTKYADPLMESILLHLLPTMEENTGLKLFPTYSYYRVYRRFNQLEPHLDRHACEISASLCLGNKLPEKYPGWPLYIEDIPFIMEPGDLAIYRGLEMNHYRYPFEVDSESFQSQVFLHYVDANGPNAEWKYDKRESIGA